MVNVPKGSPTMILAALLAVSWVASAALASPDPQALLGEIKAAKIEVSRAARVKGVRLKAGLGSIVLSDGVVFPVSAVGGKSVELVYLGKGRFGLDPPDDGEAGQLELFTGSRRLDRQFDDAVFVVGIEAAVAGLLKTPAGAVDAALAERARSVYADWRQRRERELLDIDRAILLDALHEPSFQGYFAAWLRGGALAGVTYVVEPGAREQVTLGRFVALDADAKEQRELAKAMHKAQRKGRLVGLEVSDLGQWDTWVSAPLRGADGQAAPGFAAYEPESYRLEVTVAEKAARFDGIAKIELRQAMPGARAVLLSLPRDLEVHRVADAAGAPLFFHRCEDDITVLLPSAPQGGERVSVTVEYSGHGIERDGNLYANLSTLGWYPHAGSRDRARYELTLHWPRDLDVVASGRRSDGGEEAGGRKWERRVLDEPALGVSFEVGHFHQEVKKVGHVEVTFAFGAGTAMTGSALREAVMDTVSAALPYYERTFGPYPLDYMTVSTASRGFSQGLLGFVTLSDLMFGFETPERRRQSISHELAHQWWGDQVGWVGYRDQWISEALASYSAGLFESTQDKDHKGVNRAVDLAEGWRRDLTSPLADMRPLESAGPVVMGARLYSSRAGSAYEPIVYKKGMLVMNLLARTVGEDVFPRVLEQVVKAARGRELSTQEFLDILQTTTGADLGTLSRQFIFGTGLPEVFYDYRFERQPAGGWIVRGSVRRASPLLFSYRVVRSGTGWDVSRTARAQLDDVASPIIVPVEVAMLDASKPKGKGPGGSNTGMRGNVVLRGEETPLALEVNFEPKRFWIDPKERSLTLPFDEVQSPATTYLVRGVQAAALGNAAEAETWFHRAEGAQDAVPEGSNTVYYRDIQERRRVQRAQVELSRARLALDQGKDAEASSALSRAQGPFTEDDEEVRRLQARLEVRRGEYERVFRRLRKAVIEKQWRDAETAALMAIAAHESGHPEEFAKALKMARDATVDTSLLGEASPER